MIIIELPSANPEWQGGIPISKRTSICKYFWRVHAQVLYNPYRWSPRLVYECLVTGFSPLAAGMDMDLRQVVLFCDYLNIVELHFVGTILWLLSDPLFRTFPLVPIGFP